MHETLGFEELARMIRRAATLVRSEQARLSELDSHGGDGDHGTTMARAVDRAEQAINDVLTKIPGDLLQGVGWAIMGADGGAAGPLFGSFFMGMAQDATGETMDATALAAAFDAGLGLVQDNTRASVGDKTVLDALVPAVEGFRAAVAAGSGMEAALAAAADAALRGAGTTVDMQARFGRAKNLGEASCGHADPGATSVALIFRGFHEGVQDG